MHGYFILTPIPLAHTNKRVSIRRLGLANNIGNPDIYQYCLAM